MSQPAAFLDSIWNSQPLPRPGGGIVYQARSPAEDPVRRGAGAAVAAAAARASRWRDLASTQVMTAPVASPTTAQSTDSFIFVP
jgi:hypothetical protein